jgi:cytidylate kinase
MIIAIDGPAGAGKGTLGRRVAARFNFAYLDTGLLYRTVAAAVLRAGYAIDDTPAAEAIAQSLSPSMVIDGPELRTEVVGNAASAVAAMPGVRAALLAFQRRFASHPPDGAKGAVLDGRDIGTVICPSADLKLYLTASSEVRARRRFKELRAAGEPSIYADILKDVEERDFRDMGRTEAPLKPAVDAIVIDTTALDAEAVFTQAVEKIERLQQAREQ